jgi:hypothetical protein
MDRKTYCTHVYEMFQQTIKPLPTTITFSGLHVSYLIEESRRYQAFQLLQELHHVCPDYYKDPTTKK